MNNELTPHERKGENIVLNLTNATICITETQKTLNNKETKLIYFRIHRGSHEK